MSTLSKRIVTAVILVAVIVIVLFGLRPPAAVIFCSACLVMGCWEWSGFLRWGYPLRAGYLLGGVLLAGLLYLTLPDNQPPVPIFVAASLWWLLVAGWLNRHDIGYDSLLVALAGYACLLPAWVALSWLLSFTHGAWLLVWMIAIVAAADTGAYFTGKAVGRRKLAPQLSPGKTLEGLAGGLLAATVVAVTGAWLAGFALWHFAIAGPLIAAVSVVGDLAVSACKRNAGLKDTGRVLPGHGGVMDRIDSLVAAAPVFALVLSLSRNFVV